MALFGHHSIHSWQNPARQTSTAGVEESSLTADVAHVLEVLIDGERDGVAMVRVGVGEGEEVR